jgi:hypothetical protein
MKPWTKKILWGALYTALAIALAGALLPSPDPACLSNRYFAVCE